MMLRKGEDFIAINGRKPTRAEDEAIVNKLTKETVLTGWWNDKLAWELEPEDYAKAVVDYSDISKETRNKVNNFLAERNISLFELSKNEQIEWIEKIAGTLSLPNSMQKAAMRERLQELRDYLSKTDEERR